MRLLAVLAGAAALAATAVLAAAAAGPLVRRTPAGNAAAAATLLTARDLGSGWTGTAPVSSGLQLSCKGWSPSEKGIVETGGAGMPSISGGATGPIISQMTSVYASASEASSLWQRAVRPGLVRCATEALETVSANGIKVKVLSQGTLAVSKVGSMTAGFRVVADLISPKQTLKTYFDVLLVGRGTTLAEISISSLGGAVPAKVEHALAALVYRRIGLPVA